MNALNVASGGNQAVNLTTTAGGNLALGSVSAGMGTATLNVAGNITGSGNASPATINVTAGTLGMTTGTGVGTSGANGINTLVPSISASSTGTGVWINSKLAGVANPVTFTGVTAGAGPIVLTANSDLNTTGAVTATTGPVFIIDTGGNITFGSTVTASASGVTVTGSGDVVNNSTISGSTGVTITAGTNGLAANLTNNGTITSTGPVALKSALTSNTTMTLGGPITGTTLTITGGNVGNAINLTAVVTTTSDLTINGGLGTEILTFAPGAGSSIGGNVLSNGPLTGNATLNVTDPAAIAVTGTFTIDFGAGHTGTDNLNILPTAGTVITTTAGVPTGVSFTATKTPWVLANFILGQDHIPGFGF